MLIIAAIYIILVGMSAQLCYYLQHVVNMSAHLCCYLNTLRIRVLMFAVIYDKL